MDRLPLFMNYLTEEMIQKAENELGETSERKKKALMELKSYLKKDTKLYCSTSDDFLLQFLRARKFNVKKTVSLIQNLYHEKKHRKEVFGKVDFQSIVKVLQDKIVTVLPNRDKDGCFVLIVQLRYWNVNEMTFASVLHAAASIIVCLIDMHPATQVCGAKCILDVKDLGFTHICHMPVKHLFFVATGVTNSIPLRVKAVHVFNESMIIQYVWNLMKLLLSDKLKKRILFHSTNVASLQKELDPAILPEDFGGTLQCDKEHLPKLLEDLEGTYYELMSYGYKTKNQMNQQEKL